jgi:hypothetical protein
VSSSSQRRAVSADPFLRATSVESTEQPRRQDGVGREQRAEAARHQSRVRQRVTVASFPRTAPTAPCATSLP